jgi:hypothetical protein
MVGDRREIGLDRLPGIGKIAFLIRERSSVSTERYKWQRHLCEGDRNECSTGLGQNGARGDD